MRIEVAIGGRLYGALLAVWSIVLPGCDMDRSGHRPRAEAASFEQKGEASWYGPGFHGRRTASGETFDQNDLTAAHRTLPLGTKAEVTDVETGKSVEVTINDRGPYVKDRVIDLSKAAAKELGMTEDGTTTVKIEADPPRTPQAGKDDTRNGLR
jgi:rare lipoprotein A (peptidoglycan hydrolase)